MPLAFDSFACKNAQARRRQQTERRPSARPRWLCSASLTGRRSLSSLLARRGALTLCACAAFASAQTAFQCTSPLLPRRHRSDHQVGPESSGFPPQGMSLFGSPSTGAPSSPCCLKTLASSPTSSPTDVCSLSTSFSRSPKPQIRKLPPRCTILHALILPFAHPLGCPELPCATASTCRLVLFSLPALHLPPAQMHVTAL